MKQFAGKAVKRKEIDATDCDGEKLPTFKTGATLSALPRLYLLYPKLAEELQVPVESNGSATAIFTVNRFAAEKIPAYFTLHPGIEIC